jgi:hypothetical protein
MSKLHVEMAKTHPASFALLPDSISLVQSYWSLVVKLGEKYESLGAGDEAEGKSLAEKTGLRALLLIRACAKMAFNPAQTFKYQTPQDKEERKQSVELVKSQLFTEDFVVNVMELLVTQFFRFRNIDFQEWAEEPEDWEKREEENADAWEFSIRSCSEKLFLDLVIHFKDLLIPRLLNVFYSFASKRIHYGYEVCAMLIFLFRHRESQCATEGLALLRYWLGSCQFGTASGFQCIPGAYHGPRGSIPRAGV